MKHTLPSLLFALMLTPTAVPLHAAEPEVSRAETEQGVELTLALENAEMTDLVHWVSQYVSKNIILHPDVRGRVTVISAVPIDQADAFRIFKSVLQVHGYAVVETADAIKVLPEASAAQSNAPVNGVRNSEGSDDIVVRIVQLRNISAAQVQSLVRPMMAPTSLLTVYPDNNLLVIADRASNMAKLLSIIDSVDRAGAISIEVVPLRYAQAGTLKKLVNEALPASLKGSSDGAKGLSVAADPRSNSILLSGNSNAIEKVRTLIEHLDQPPREENQTQVLDVSFGEVKALLPLLQSAATSIASRSKGDEGGAGEVKVEASQEFNAVVVTGPPEVQSAVQRIVTSLDIRRPQVLVEAMIVEVGDDLAKELGVKWLTNRPEDGTLVGVGALQGGVRDFKDARPPNLGSGLTLGFYSSDELRGLVRALESNSSANILSRPTLVTQDNAQAEILVGESVPFVTGSQSSAATPADNPFQTIERQDIGVTLKVKPRVNRDNSISLEVEQKAESIAPSRPDAADIITNKRSVKTRVVVDDDQVLVLGGLIRDELTTQDSKVPFFGRIPYLGKLFSGTSNTGSKKNLMVFIHPRILRDQGDNADVTLPLYNEMRERQGGQAMDPLHLDLPMEPPQLEAIAP